MPKGSKFGSKTRTCKGKKSKGIFKGKPRWKIQETAAGERARSAPRGDAVEVRLEDSYKSNPHYLDKNSSDLPLNAGREVFSSASAKKTPKCCH